MTGPVNNSSAVTKAQLAADTIEEQLLQLGIVADDQLMAALKNNPQLESALQKALSLISSQFSNIINQKFGENSQTVVNNLSQSQINSLNSQISTVKGQISTLQTTISNLMTTQTNQQTAVTNDQNAITTLNNEISALTPNVNALYATVQSDQTTVNNDQTAVNTATTDLQNATTKLSFDQANLNPYIGSSGSIASYISTIQTNDFSGEDVPSQQFQKNVANPIVADLEANPPNLNAAKLQLDTYIGSNASSFTTAQSNDITSLEEQLSTAAGIPITQDQVAVNNATTALNSATSHLTADQATLTADTNAYNAQNAQLQAYMTQLGQAGTQLTTDQNALAATTATINSDNTQLGVYNSTLSTLQTELAAAQTAYNNGVAFFDKLTPLEKEMFKELYPSVTFPA